MYSNSEHDEYACDLLLGRAIFSNRPTPDHRQYLRLEVIRFRAAATTTTAAGLRLLRAWQSVIANARRSRAVAVTNKQCMRNKLITAAALTVFLD